MKDSFKTRKNLIRELEQARRRLSELEASGPPAEGKEEESALRQALADSRLRRLETSALLAAARAVLEYQDFEKAARAIFDICKELTGATSGYVALVSRDGKENEVLFLDAGGLPCTVDESLPMPVRGLRGEALNLKRTVIDNDFASSEWARYLPEGHVELRNVLFAPLIVQGKAAGLLGMANKEGGFTEEDARLATAFGELVAVALANDWTYESLEKSEEQYRSLMQSATDAIIIADSDGRITSWNRGAERMFGYGDDEVQGERISMLMPEEYRPRHTAGIKRFMETSEPRIIGRTVEMSGLRRDGSVFPMELSLSTWSTRDGTFFTGIIRDITERKKTEAAEVNARAQVQSYATRLSILHRIGLSLNRETDVPRLFRSVLKAAAEITSSGVGVMTLINQGQTEVIAMYYAPWYEERCGIGDAIPNLHQRIAALTGKGEDATLLSDLRGLERLPDGHLPLRELLIGTIRDTKGRVLGHFLLSDKADGAAYTDEDREIISLLAAQSSVALVSAENFEREHLVAESLQKALLPDALIRDDLEIGLLYQSAGPMGKVGGDFYDFIELDDHRLAVVVGDVCGKGLAAATYIAMIKYMLRAYLAESHDPGDCLTRLNSAVHNQVPIEKFVTVGLSVIDTGEMIITHASAGHPPPLVCRRESSHALDIQRAVPLGVLSENRYVSSRSTIAGACSISLYTDGLLDARAEGAEPFGEERLLRALSENCCIPPQQVAKKLIDAAVEYSGDNLRDDIALVVVGFPEQLYEQE
jgi:PAS domain S-box-containing protein